MCTILCYQLAFTSKTKTVDRSNLLTAVSLSLFHGKNNDSFQNAEEWVKLLSSKDLTKIGSSSSSREENTLNWVLGTIRRKLKFCQYPNAKSIDKKFMNTGSFCLFYFRKTESHSLKLFFNYTFAHEKNLSKKTMSIKNVELWLIIV